MTDRSILVVGGGITGVSSAEWLRRDGWTVTLIDRVDPGDPDQASFGNAGLLARASVTPVATPALVRKGPKMALSQDAPLFLRWPYLPRMLPWLIPFLRNANTRRIRAVTGHISSMTFDCDEQHMALAKGTRAERFFRTDDYIHLYTDRSQFDADALAHELLRDNGFTVTTYDRATLLERDPHLGPDYTFGSSTGQQTWLASPGRYVAALFDHYRANGGLFKRAEVRDITPGPQPSVTLKGGDTLSADKIVLSAGAWSGPLARKTGVPMLLEAERGYHVSMLNPSIQPPCPYMVADAKFVTTPMDGTLRAAGLVEFAGLTAAASRAPTDFIEGRLKRLYPTLQFDRAKHWMGRRPTTPDSLPVLGESPRAPGIVHAYGGQHVGLTIGPKLGRLVADLATGRHPNMDLTAYRPDRF